MDHRRAGAVDLDGTQYGTVVHSGLAKPMMLIGSQNSLPDQRTSS
jgi:hypothetical protein